MTPLLRFPTKSRLVSLFVALALVAAACGVPDDVATEDGEITLDTLTPVEPAEPSDSTDDVETSNADTTTTVAEDAAEDAGDDDTEDPDEVGIDDADTVTDGDAAEGEESTATTEAETTTTTEAAETTTTTEAETTTTETTQAPAPTGTQALSDIDLELELVASLSSPVAFATRPGTSDIFIAEQGGRIVRLPEGTGTGADTTLDLRGSVSGGNEQGLLGLAFAPGGQRLLVNYTNTSGSTVIARYTMSGNSAVSPEILLTIPQPFGNHNGGQLAFGPDGFLYIGMGDGGSAGDPQGNGQNPNTLHGSILRIDVSGATGYTVPASNPFVDGGGAPEVYVWGIRNAWRFGFDSVTGDLWIGDVGQDRQEEVTVLRSGTASGANLGWNLVEGTESFRGLAAPPGHRGPIVVYSHGSGRCSITGGEVYRGTGIPGLTGTYLYGDFCSGEVFGFRAGGAGSAQRLALPAIDRLTSFGIDSSGEAYVISRGGGIFKVVAG